MSTSPSNENKTNWNLYLLAIFAGMLLGIIIGAAFHQVGLGIAIGAGLAFTFAIITKTI